MANKEVQDQIKALRFRRALALATADDPVNIALKALVESWLEEARLTSAAQIKGGVSRAKELTAAAALLQLDLIELDHRLANRQPESPALVPAPATERIETDPTASARAAELVADSAAQGRGMIIAGEAQCLGDVGHAAHTWLGPRDEATGSSRWQCRGVQQQEHDGPCEVAVQCSRCQAASNAQRASWFARHEVPLSQSRFRADEMRDADHAEALFIDLPRVETASLREVLALESSTLIREAFREVSGSFCPDCDADTHRCKGCGAPTSHGQGACCAECGIKNRAVFDRGPVPAFMFDTINVEPIIGDSPPDAYFPPQIIDVTPELRATLSGASTSLEPIVSNPLTVATGAMDHAFIGRAIIEQAAAQLGFDLDEQAVHNSIDEEYAHVTAEPIATPSPFREASSTFAHNSTPRPTNVPAEATYSWDDLGAKPRVPGNIPAHVSPSQLSTMDKCPAQARMSRYDGMPGIPIWGGVGGTGFHKAVEHIEREAITAGAGSWAIWDHVLQDAEQHWTKAFHLAIAEEIANGHGIPMDQWYASNSGKENYSWWLVEGAEMLRRYVHWRRKNDDGRKILILPDGKPALELELHLDVEYLDVKVILDSVWVLPNGDLDIVDYKTGSRMDKDTIQLGTQAHALRRALDDAHGGSWDHPADITAHYFDARKSILTPQFDPIERHPTAELSVRYPDLDDKRRNRPAVPKRSDMCIACPVRYLCPAYNAR